MYRHVETVSVMLVVVISATMDWLTSVITTKQQKPLLPRGWQELRIFQWERQNGSWTLMPISKNRGYPAAFTVSSFTSRCFCMPLWQGGVSMTTPCTGAGGSHCKNKNQGQNPLPWSLLVLTLCIGTLRTCVGTCTNSGGYPEEADVKRPRRSTSV